MPEYQVAAKREAAGLDRAAERSAADARLDIQRASNYVLAVVLFAVALFFGGMCTKVRSVRPRLAMLIIGSAVFLGALVWTATFPVSIAV
jgi:hypothetical protein